MVEITRETRAVPTTSTIYSTTDKSMYFHSPLSRSPLLSVSLYSLLILLKTGVTEERQSLLKLNHEGIVHILDITDMPQFDVTIITMELCDGGELVN